MKSVRIDDSVLSKGMFGHSDSTNNSKQFNLSLIDGIFIDPFNQAIVMPLIKKPSLSEDV